MNPGPSASAMATVAAAGRPARHTRRQRAEADGDRLAVVVVGIGRRREAERLHRRVGTEGDRRRHPRMVVRRRTAAVRRGQRDRHRASQRRAQPHRHRDRRTALGGHVGGLRERHHHLRRRWWWWWWWWWWRRRGTSVHLAPGVVGDRSVRQVCAGCGEAGQGEAATREVQGVGRDADPVVVAVGLLHHVRAFQPQLRPDTDSPRVDLRRRRPAPGEARRSAPRAC